MRVAEALATEPMPEDPATVLEFGEYRLDLAGHSLTDRTGREVPLTHGEFGLFRVFVRRSGRVLSRDQLLQLLSGRDAEAYDRSIDMQVVRLRRKIEPDPKRPTLIVTVPNSGYKFAATARQIEAPAVPKPDPAEVGPGDAERRHVTALAAEVLAAEGTKLPDDPEELGFIINAWRHYAAAVVARHGGVVGESRVREVLAYFGYPVAQEHATERALHAALALVERSPEGEWRLPAGLIVRAGVASGLVVADPNGEVLGETPTDATRMQALAEPGQVIRCERAKAGGGAVRLPRPWSPCGPRRSRPGPGMAGARPECARQPLRDAVCRGCAAANRPRRRTGCTATGLAAGIVRSWPPGPADRRARDRQVAPARGPGRVHRRRTACQPAVFLFAAAPRQHVASCRGSLGAGGRFRARQFERGAFAQA